MERSYPTLSISTLSRSSKKAMKIIRIVCSMFHQAPKSNLAFNKIILRRNNNLTKLDSLWKNSSLSKMKRQVFVRQTICSLKLTLVRKLYTILMAQLQEIRTRAKEPHFMQLKRLSNTKNSPWHLICQRLKSLPQWLGLVVLAQNKKRLMTTTMITKTTTLKI